MQIKFLRPSQSIDFFPSFLSCLLVFRKYFREIEHFFILFRLSLTHSRHCSCDFSLQCSSIFFSLCQYTRNYLGMKYKNNKQKSQRRQLTSYKEFFFIFLISSLFFTQKNEKSFLNLSPISFFSIQRSS